MLIAICLSLVVVFFIFVAMYFSEKYHKVLSKYLILCSITDEILGNYQTLISHVKDDDISDVHRLYIVNGNQRLHSMFKTQLNNLKEKNNELG